MFRKLDSYIARFYSESKGALLVTGARQTGKTYSLRKYAKQHYKHFVEINFVDRPDAVGLFAGAVGVKDLLLRLSAFAEEPLEAGHTFIFFR